MLQGVYKLTLAFSLAIVVFQVLSRPLVGGAARRSFLCLLLAFGWLAGRAAFYGILDVFQGTHVSRYMRCASPLLVVILFLAAVCIAGLVRERFLRRPARSGGAEAAQRPT
jgi:hypothetical protein